MALTRKQSWVLSALQESPKPRKLTERIKLKGSIKKKQRQNPKNLASVAPTKQSGGFVRGGSVQDFVQAYWTKYSRSTK